MLKNKVYKTNPHAPNELKEHFQATIRSIAVEELVRVNNNFLKSVKRAYKKMDSTYSIFYEQGEYQIMMCKIYLSFNQLTSVNTPPPALLVWRQTRSFRPAGLEENFRDRMSQ